MCLQDVLLLLLNLFTLIAIILVPVYLYNLQKRDKILETQHKLFITLMAHRKNLPTNDAFVESLNTVEVVFHKSQNILQLYRNFHNLRKQKPQNPQQQEHSFVSLMLEIANYLGYKNLDFLKISDVLGKEDLEN